MKTGKIGLAILVGFITLLAGWETVALAYYPPCREVTTALAAVNVGGQIRHYFRHSVTDPTLNTVMWGDSSSYTGYFDNVDDFRVADGIVIGVYSNNDNPKHKYVYLSVYDPVLHTWMAEGITDLGDTNYSGSFPFWAYLSCANGVVAIGNADSAIIAPKAHMWAKTYDPKRGQWQRYYRESGINTDSSPYTQDGVAMFSLANLTGFGNMYALVWVVYDPRDGVWRDKNAEIDTPPYPSITNATVYYTDTSGNPQHWGYDSGTWQAGKVTLPVAWFQVAPTTGPPPLSVLLTDMSLGGTTWTTDFGDGAGPQNFRSGLHTFNSQGTYNVTQKVSNSNWPLSSITQTQAVHVLDVTAPVGSMYIEPAVIYFIGEAIYTNNPDVYLHYAASGMDLGSTVRFSEDHATWTDWMTYTSGIGIYEMILSAGDGLKTVWAQFKDSSGNVGECSDSVFLDTTPPVAGTLTATGGPGQVTLRWTGFGDANGIWAYRLYCSTTGFPTGKTGLVYQGGGLTFTHRRLKGGTTYYYRLVAEDRVGNASAGVTASATTKGVPLPLLQLLLN